MIIVVHINKNNDLLVIDCIKSIEVINYNNYQNTKTEKFNAPIHKTKMKRKKTHLHKFKWMMMIFITVMSFLFSNLKRKNIYTIVQMGVQRTQTTMCATKCWS